MTIRRELIDELLKDYETSQDILGEGGLLKELTKAVVERCLETELDTHLGYPKHGRIGNATGNMRNGHSQKTLKGEQGHIDIEVPRDRQGLFNPQLVKKGQTRLEGFDDKILALYARGMTTRDFQAQLQELYDVEVSPTLISNVTEAVMDEVRQWQSRPLESVYPIVYVDCLMVNVRENQRVLKKALYLVLGVDLSGQKDLLGMWMAQTEGAKFWLSVLTEVQNRGVKDIFIACVDGLTGLPQAIETVYPQTRVQLCMVHLMRNSLRYVSHKHMKAVATDLKAIYSASTESEAEFNLELFREKWDRLYPSISKSWRIHWARVIPLFAFPEDIRKVIYTTNAIESVNMTLRHPSRAITTFSPPMKRSTRSSTWRCAFWRRSGRCPSVTGSPRSIGWPSSLGGGFRDEQAVGRGKFLGLFRSCIPASYTDRRKTVHGRVQVGKKSLPKERQLERSKRLYARVTSGQIQPAKVAFIEALSHLGMRRERSHRHLHLLDEELRSQQPPLSG